MPRLIDADALLDTLRESLDGLHGIYEGLQFLDEKKICGAQISCFHEIILRVKEAPTIDAEPVRHGQWILVLADKRGRGGVYNCTACNGCRPIKSAYCPDCGAKMDGGASDGE